MDKKEKVILNNKFGITNINELQKVESELVNKRLEELKLQPMENKYDIVFDMDYLKSIHQYIFQDVYPWAGEFRENGAVAKQRMFSDGSSHIVKYSNSMFLENNINNTLQELLEDLNYGYCKDKKEFCDKLGNLYIKLDYLHPFAEGNSRTLREFTRQIAQNAGFEVQWEKTEPNKDELYMARDMGVNDHDNTRLIKILNEIVKPIEEPVKIKIKKKSKDFDR
jgi:cell filamentation protein